MVLVAGGRKSSSTIYEPDSQGENGRESQVLKHLMGEKIHYQNTANDVAEMRNVVHIGQGTRDENVLLAGNGERWFSWGSHFVCVVSGYYRGVV